LTHLSEKEAIDYLLHELPGPNGLHSESSESDDVGESGLARPKAKDGDIDEHSPLLRNQIGVSKRPGLRQFEHHHHAHTLDFANEDPTVSFVGLNTLEIAAIADAKKFLSQRVVQKIVDDIWSGNIVFWDTLSVSTKKHAQIYNKRYVHRYAWAVAGILTPTLEYIILHGVKLRATQLPNSGFPPDVNHPSTGRQKIVQYCHTTGLSIFW